MSAANERSLWLPFDEGARQGELKLQVCKNCATVQYPAREVCRRCLSSELKWQTINAGGKILSHTVVHVSNEERFRDGLPCCIGSIKLDCGPVVLANLPEGPLETGTRVRVEVKPDESGRGILFAKAADE